MARHDGLDAAGCRMSLQHIGTCHLAKARPLVATATDGTWSVSLRVLDRWGTHQTEGWLITYTGAQAQAWWDREGHTLEPGDTLRVVLHRARVHSVGRDRGGALAELQAQVVEAEIVARARRQEAA